MEQIHERLQAARENAGYKTASQAADAAGWKKSTYLGHENGSRGVTLDMALTYCRFFRVSLDWLAQGKGAPKQLPAGLKPASELLEKPRPAVATQIAAEARPGLVEIQNTEYASIARFDAMLSAGPGSLIEEDPEPLGYHLLEQQWLNGLTRASPQHLAVVRVSGDSMEPTLSNQDWVLLDTTQRRLNHEGIYALRVGDAVWVKRISLNLKDRTIRIMSDNQFYETQEIEESDVHTIGRVLSIVSRRL